MKVGYARVSSVGQNLHPPKPTFSPFLAGGDNSNPAFYLCREKDQKDKNWHYGYQTVSKSCSTAIKDGISPQVLVLQSIPNKDTGN